MYLSLLFQHLFINASLSFFSSAVMLAGWLGRTVAGVFAATASMPAVDGYLIAPYRAFVVQIDELPYLLLFLFGAVVTSGLGSAWSAAKEKKTHLDGLFEQSPEAIMLVDLEDRVLRVNSEFTQIFGYAMDEIVNRPSIDLITPIHLRADALKNHARLAKGRRITVETVRQRKDGSSLNVSEVSFPVIANGKHLASYFIFRDITESKRALEELQRAQAELAHLSRITIMGELARSIAHEVNQPIGAIVTNGNAATRWLGQDPPALRDAEESLDCIVRDANRASQVIGRIRALLNKTPTPMVHLDINDVIRDVLILTRYETSRRGAIVVTELSSNLPLILGDRIQLQQVMLNLILNSLDAMTAVLDRPRQVLVKSSFDLDSVLVRVQDSGNGWEDQHATSIFDPFFTTKKDGIGMGLTISQSIIENHEGSLWAERGTPYGAILKFSLPIVTTSK